MENVTLEKLQLFCDLYAALEWAKEQEPPYPQKPKKSLLPTVVDSSVAKKYTSDFEKYEKEVGEYSLKLKEYQEKKNAIDGVIDEFIKIESGLYSIPEKYQAKVYSKAYQDGHSEGLLLYNQLIDLVGIFN